MEWGNRRWGGLVLMAVIVLLFIELVAPLRRIFSPLQWVSQPITARSWQFTTNFRQRLSGSIAGRDLTQKLAELEAQRAAVLPEYVNLETLKQENESLRRLASFTSTSALEITSTAVLGQAAGEHRMVLRLAAGSDQGVASGQAVVSPTGVFVGVIDSVGSKTSTMRLVGHPNVKVPVRFFNGSEANGLLTSAGGLALQVIEIPKAQKIEPGTLVVTALGLDGVPPSLPVATVSSAAEAPEGLWQTAAVAGIADFTSLTVVGIVRTP